MQSLYPSDQAEVDRWAKRMAKRIADDIDAQVLGCALERLRPNPLANIRPFMRP